MTTSAETVSNTPPQKIEVDTELSLSKKNSEQQSFDSMASTNEVNPEADEDTPAPLFYKPPTRQFVLIILALSLNVFLASLDQIIVSTSIPAITREFQTLGDISWLGTAYMMTATATQPLYGKFSDIFGRKSTMIFANIMFLVGSAICGWANSMTVLIVGRGVAGIGAGGLMAMVFIIMSDMLDMRERGKYIGFVGVVYSLASVIGPVLGGAFSDKLTWRWSFWINLPVGAVSVTFIAIFLNLPIPRGSLSDKIKRIDILGSVILMGSVILILLPLSWGGSKHPWDSATIIGLLVGGVLTTIAFILIEWKVAKEPTVPIHLFKIRNLWATYSSLFFGGMAFFGILFYLPIYFQVVKGESATVGGFETVPMVMGITITATGSGIWVLKRGTYAFFPAVGNFLFTVGAGLCVLFSQDTQRVVTVFVLLICGVGVGCTVQTSTLAVQAAAKPKYMATVTVLVQFIRILGQVFGIAIVGTIFNNKLESSLKTKFPLDPQILKVAQDYTRIADYGEMERKWIYDSFLVALHYSFYCSVACSALAFVLSCFVQHKELKTNETHEKYRQEAKDAEMKEVIV
ncbi:hypothetical protein BGZ81_003940 [Podila clonocystis]|nr:hypothetical protein BGZ81_003940 [Podila clonocystis]